MFILSVNQSINQSVSQSVSQTITLWRANKNLIAGCSWAANLQVNERSPC